MGKEKSSENSPKKKSKLFKIIGIAILSLILIISITAYFLLKTPADKGAYIQTFEGDVQVFTKNSWQTPVINQELSLNDKIKTSTGSATLLLMEKAIISIEPNTEIEISSLAENDLKIKLKIFKIFTMELKSLLPLHFNLQFLILLLII